MSLPRSVAAVACLVLVASSPVLRAQSAPMVEPSRTELPEADPEPMKAIPASDPRLAQPSTPAPASKPTATRVPVDSIRRRAPLPVEKRLMVDGAAAGVAGGVALLGVLVAVPVAASLAAWPGKEFDTQFYRVPNLVLGAAALGVGVMGLALAAAPWAAVLVRWVLGARPTWPAALGATFMSIAAGVAALAVSWFFAFHTPPRFAKVREELTGSLGTPWAWGSAATLMVVLAAPVIVLGAAASTVVGAEVEEARKASVKSK